jgi:hypothetical protein
MRRALAPLERYIVTPRVAKHRVYLWLRNTDLPSNALSVIATDQDFDYGILNSSIHTSWSERLGSSLEDRPQYTNEVYETYPFPCPTDEQRAEVAKWAKYLDDVRNQLLRSDERLTMTVLYNELETVRVSRDSGARAYPLLIAHERLDAAVAAAYGWEWPLGEDEMLGRLLALNLERSETM